MDKSRVLKIAGDMAREKRISMKLTCREVSERYGKSPAVISRFENGLINSLPYFIFAMCGFDPDYTKLICEWEMRRMPDGENVD